MQHDIICNILLQLNFIKVITKLNIPQAESQKQVTDSNQANSQFNKQLDITNKLEKKITFFVSLLILIKSFIVTVEPRYFEVPTQMEKSSK